ncbi:type 1 glutamine amidotransferase domain-containing protein [Noviherbaspirillum malthae]|uniref:type 1 glutamine amidotransferase domain-containing protein n=1 Tax=Noviherbaspirillum malthae TaxID=1260987 RepID=UPI00188F7DE2|nr:type 1 glutamine amidotransferase domain-containing protein [Noviherbaspirillum malthae]
MDPALNGMNIAILVTDGFEQSELTEPKKALEAAGALTRIVSDKFDKVQGMNHDQPGDKFTVDLLLREADAKSFDAVLLPGGKVNAAALREMGEAQRFVQNMDEDNKPIAVICHGGWLLVSAGLVEGRTMTSFPALEQDIRSAGGNWVDQEVVVDGNLVSSRTPEDIPAFNEKMVDVIAHRLQSHLRGTGDDHAVGIAGS